MKTSKVSLFCLTVIVVMLASFSAQAQSARRIVATVPFNFYVNDKALPAGQYSIEAVEIGGSTALRIQSADGHITAIVPARSAAAKSKQRQSRLVFNRFGDQYFLSQVQSLNEKAFHRLPVSHVEEQLANNGLATKRNAVTIVAHR